MKGKSNESISNEAMQMLQTSNAFFTSCTLFPDRASNLYWFSNMDAIYTCRTRQMDEILHIFGQTHATNILKELKTSVDHCDTEVKNCHFFISLFKATLKESIVINTHVTKRERKKERKKRLT